MGRVDRWLDEDVPDVELARRRARRHRQWMWVGIWMALISLAMEAAVIAAAFVGGERMQGAFPSVWSASFLFFVAAAWEWVMSLHTKEAYLRLKRSSMAPRAAPA